MAPKLYMTASSPPVRAVLIVAKAIGLDLELIEVDLWKKEQLSPEYIKLNPQHTVPTLVEEDGFVIWDNAAIIIYLVSKYAKDDSLYPKDVKRRAIINQRLHFNSGVAFPRIVNVLHSLLDGQHSIDPKDKESVLEMYGFMEKFLEGRKWIAGDTVTIADYNLISSISSVNPLIPVDDYPKLTAWMKNVENLPPYEVNKEGLDILMGATKSALV